MLGWSSMECLMWLERKKTFSEAKIVGMKVSLGAVHACILSNLFKTKNLAEILHFRQLIIETSSTISTWFIWLFRASAFMNNPQQNRMPANNPKKQFSISMSRPSTSSRDSSSLWGLPAALIAPVKIVSRCCGCCRFNYRANTTWGFRVPPEALVIIERRRISIITRNCRTVIDGKMSWK